MLSWRAHRNGEISVDDHGPRLQHALLVKDHAHSCSPHLSSFSLFLPLHHPFAVPSQVPHQLSPSISFTGDTNLVAGINRSDQRTASVRARGNVIWKSFISQACVALKMMEKE